VQFALENAHTSIQGSGGIPAFPARWVTAYFELFPVNGFLATVVPKQRAAQGLSASTATPEPHDFAVRIRRLTSASALRVHRISPRVRDVANAPLVDEMREVMALIWVAREAEYFFDEDWTSFTDLPVVPIGRIPRAAICACAAGKSAGSRDRARDGTSHDETRRLPLLEH
jgi:hypothetical protein